ncbi:PH domain-containing protein DDB_G0267786-like [Xenia sp. Carnegie-2017]|uniref:PH domain-containing protein DDB_G0267786-like n=1 Tax=Xenia sp. Carnegie-2017 TaxID=2897299 RepID=UPI001F04E898|nr:PH domain-containing protein DDB_G0267786-like [Xenia sp. Carnegie-2017]
MGNILPLDSSKKEQCEEIAKEFVATFSGYYVLYYGVELVKMKMKEIENDANSEDESEKKLMYREDASCKNPLKMGHLKKKGAIVKNWKNRYFVVNPDFSVSYYETEDAYNQGCKPKGNIILAGYDVEENADDANLQKLKQLAKTLGIKEESLPSPEKTPPNTLILSHDRRRKYYITAKSDEEKMDWVEMFKTCARKTKGFKNKDPVGNAAFTTAYRQACKESNWYAKKVAGGTEEQILSETLVELVNDRVLASVYYDLVDNFTIRKKVRKQVVKILESTVLGIVKPAYQGLVETTEKMKNPIEKTFNEKKEDIIKVYVQIKEKLTDKIEAILSKIGTEISKDAHRLYEDLKELTVRTTKEMRNECVVRLMDKLIEQTNSSKNVVETMKMHYRKFDGVLHRTNAWDHWYKVYNMEKEIIGIIARYEKTFDESGNYSYVYKSHDMLAWVADAAFNTFELTLETYSKENDIYEDNTKASNMMKKVKDEVLLKYDYDSQVTPHEISFKITTDIVKEYFITKAEPIVKEILKPLESSIPKPLEELISIRERYHLYVEEIVKNLIRREEKRKVSDEKNEISKKSNSEKKKATLEEKNGTLQEESEVSEKKSEASGEKNNAPKEKSEVSKEKSEVLEEKSEVLEEKSEVLEEKSEVLEEKIEVLEEKNEVLEVKSEVSEEKSEVSKEKNEVSKEKNEVSEEKNEVLEVKSEVSEEKSEVSKEKNEVSKEKNEVSEERNEVSAKKE